MADAAVFDLSPGQQQLLVGGLTGPVLRLQLLVEVPTTASAEILSGRWVELAQRHDVLHTAFLKPQGLSRLLQTTDAAPAPFTTAVTTSGSDLAAAEWEAPLDLTAGGLVRAAHGAGHLVLTAAAAVADARTLRLLADELLSGTSSDEEPLPFLDFAAWEAEQLEEDSADARVAKAYWRGLLGSAELGAPEPIPARELRGVPLDAVSGLSDEEWLAAFALVRRRRVGVDALAVIAVAVSGRTDEELEQAVGPFERYVPILAPVDDSADFPATTSRLAADVAAAARFALFAPRPVTTGAFSVQDDGVQRAVGRFPVELVVGSGRATLWFDAEQVSEAEAGRLAEQVTTAALAWQAAPATRADDIDILGPQERAFLEGSLTGEGATPAHPTVAHAIAEHVRQTPDAQAVVQGETALTYRELAERSGALASVLAGSAAPVGILLDRSVDAIVAAVGALRSGRPYVALEPAHPADRIAVQIELAGIDTVVTTSAYDAALPETVTRLGLADLTPAAAPDAEVSGDSLAYVVFTSGSTGTPKPVAVTHGNVVSYVAGLSRRIGLGADSRLATVTSLSTDLGNTSVFGALVNGGTLELLTEDVLASGVRLAEVVSSHGITALKITPSHLRALLSGGDVRLDLPLLVSGGEPLDPALVEQARSAGVRRVVNHYGPTETTVGVLSHELGSDVTAPIPLGRPLPHVTARVVDARGRQVPVGVAGELEISGPAVAPGYLGDQSGSGFGADSGVRRYRTGDSVVVGGDGTVRFLGRTDGQVKVRGFRVDLGEIEVWLRAEDAITDAAVVVVDDALRAFVVSPSAALDVPATLDRLRHGLPPHMVPVSVDTMSDLPRTHSGKIDRRALEARAVDGEGSAGEASGRAPQTETETRLLEIWREVMPGAAVGVEDNFFQVGGHSLLATKVIARARAAFAVDLPLHVIFASPTVAAMAVEIDARRPAEDADELSSLMADLEGMSDEEVARLLDDPPDGR